MEKFWEQLRESVIVQAVLTLALAGAVIYMGCTGQAIPELIGWAFSLVLGYYFGSKVQHFLDSK